MSTTLPALVANSQEISRQLLESGGEITPKIEAALTANDLQLPAKIEGYVFNIEQFEMYRTHFKKKAETFSEIAKSFEAAQDYLEKRLKNAAKDLGVNELLGVDHKILLVPSKPSVVIEDESKIDQLYMREKITKSVDKTKISEDLALGILVPGASLKQGEYIKITANRKALK